MNLYAKVLKNYTRKYTKMADEGTIAVQQPLDECAGLADRNSTCDRDACKHHLVQVRAMSSILSSSASSGCSGISRPTMASSLGMPAPSRAAASSSKQAKLPAVAISKQ